MSDYTVSYGALEATGPTPRKAWSNFVRKVWICALTAAENPDYRQTFGWAMTGLHKNDPMNWHRALKARGIR